MAHVEKMKQLQEEVEAIAVEHYPIEALYLMRVMNTKQTREIGSIVIKMERRDDDQTIYNKVSHIFDVLGLTKCKGLTCGDSSWMFPRKKDGDITRALSGVKGLTIKVVNKVITSTEDLVDLE